MRPFRAHKLLSRALAVVVMAATVLATPLASLGAAECVDCGACGEPVRFAAAPAQREHCCCAAGEAEAAVADGPSSSDQQQSSKQSPGDEGRCPAGCAQCCLTQGRVIVPAERGVAVLPDLRAWVGVATPTPAPPPGGVHESIFHPPKV